MTSIKDSIPNTPLRPEGNRPKTPQELRERLKNGLREGNPLFLPEGVKQKYPNSHFRWVNEIDDRLLMTDAQGYATCMDEHSNVYRRSVNKNTESHVRHAILRHIPLDMYEVLLEDLNERTKSKTNQLHKAAKSHAPRGIDAGLTETAVEVGQRKNTED